MVNLVGLVIGSTLARRAEVPAADVQRFALLGSVPSSPLFGAVFVNAAIGQRRGDRDRMKAGPDHEGHVGGGPLQKRQIDLWFIVWLSKPIRDISDYANDFALSRAVGACCLQLNIPAQRRFSRKKTLHKLFIHQHRTGCIRVVEGREISPLNQRNPKGSEIMGADRKVSSPRALLSSRSRTLFNVEFDNLSLLVGGQDGRDARRRHSGKLFNVLDDLLEKHGLL